MSSIPLTIFLHGLIALVPTIGPNGANYMTALFVDARMAATPTPPDCMTEHHPKLQFFVTATAECSAVPGCKATGTECICEYDSVKKIDPLEGKQISLEILPAPTLALKKPSGVPPDHSLPSDSREATSFSYVANLALKPFGLTVNPNYLLPNPPSDVRAHLVTRMEVPYENLTSCALAEREDGGEANVHAMSFRKLHDASASDEVSYALAQKVVANLTVPEAGPGGQIVRLHISDFGGGDDKAITLDPAQVGGYKIDVSNDTKKLNPDDACDDGVARHFAHFYEISMSPQTPPLLPHVRFTQFKSSTPLQPTVCKDNTFQVGNRPICPMATFNP